jgi:PRTRC genetic system protein A
MLNLDVCRYLTTREPLPPWASTGYDYITAGNGLWKRARNRHCSACLRLAPANVAGLPDLSALITVAGPRLPGRLLWIALDDARRRSWREPVEAMYHVYRHEDGRVRLAYPPQEAGAARSSYQGGSDPAIILDVHSHVEMGAFFSGTDDRDELGFRFYAVMGRIFTRPEIRLRLGIYGDHWELPITALFADSGPFHLPYHKDDEEESWTFDQNDATA